MIPDTKNPKPQAESIILEILSRKPRLSVKELFEYFQKKYQKSMTIQGFYKLVKQMVGQRILVKEGHLIAIDAAWIYNLLNFGNTLRQVYLENSATSANVLLNEGETKTFSFEKVIEMDNFWTHALIMVAHYYAECQHENKNVYCYNYHSWFHLVRTSQEQSLADAYTQMGMKLFVISGTKTFLDGMVASLMKQDEFTYATIDSGPLEKQNYYVTVIGDFIFETSLPKYIFQLMEDIYKGVTNISEFNAQNIFNLINLPGKTGLVISRDKQRAQKLRQSIASHFVLK